MLYTAITSSTILPFSSLVLNISNYLPQLWAFDSDYSEDSLLTNLCRSEHWHSFLSSSVCFLLSCRLNAIIFTMILAFIAVLILEGISSSSSFLAPQSIMKIYGHRTSSYLKMMSGYVPPEEDEEYRGSVQKSLQRPAKLKDLNGEIINGQQLLPLPSEGDIVLCPGKYKNERILARIRFLQYISSSNDWTADLSPLKEGKSLDIFSLDSQAKSTSAKINELTPVRAFFKRSENGYQVKFRKNSTEFILRAPSYREIPSNFTVPVKTINATVLEDDLERYEELKKRIVLSTIQFGAVGTVASTVAFGPDVSLPFLAGSLSGALYLYLLGKKTDSIGAGYSKSSKKSADGKLVQFLVTNRFAVPLLALSLFTAYNYYSTGVKPVTFSLVTKQQFLGIIAGFLSNRVALLLTEIRGEVRLEDFLSIVPGSFAEVYRESRKLDEIREKKIRDNENRKNANGDFDKSEYDEFGELVNEQVLSTVVVICGPQAAGRLSLSNSLQRNGNCNNKVRQCKFLTTDRSAASYYPDTYSFVSDDALAALKKDNKIVYQGDEKTFFGSEVPVFLNLDDLSRREEAVTVKVEKEEGGRKGLFGLFKEEVKRAVPVVLPCVLNGPPEMLEALMKVPSLKLLNIWVSLQTKEQFIEKATNMVQSELVTLKSRGKAEMSAQSSAEQVSALVNDAAKDVTYYMTRAPLFEYTLLNSGPEEETLYELEQLISNSI